MNEQKLYSVANRLITANKGLLAMDESTRTCNARFRAMGIPETGEMRRRYRELLITAPDLSASVSGVILYDETFNQAQDDGKSFLQLLAELNIMPGIKVDGGMVDLAGFPDEKLTQGLDGLRERLHDYAARGAQFAKWRAVFKIVRTTPTAQGIESNAQQLAIYAALCQECGLVPIVEPEVLMDGAHTLQQCADVSGQVWDRLFHNLYRYHVLLEGLILKANMILPGVDSGEQVSPDDVADSTVRNLLRHIPPCVPGVVFLSGGQAPELATLRLNAINARFKKTTPWSMSFSFSRAIQQPVLASWLGSVSNCDAAQQIMMHRVRCNQAALTGNYHPQMERPDSRLLIPDEFGLT